MEVQFYVGLVAGAIIWAQLFNIARILGLVCGGFVGMGIGIGLWLQHVSNTLTGRASVRILPFVVSGYVIECTILGMFGYAIQGCVVNYLF